MGGKKRRGMVQGQKKAAGIDKACGLERKKRRRSACAGRKYLMRPQPFRGCGRSRKSAYLVLCRIFLSFFFLLCVAIFFRFLFFPQGTAALLLENLSL
jgi:hypothetical protein